MQTSARAPSLRHPSLSSLVSFEDVVGGFDCLVVPASKVPPFDLALPTPQLARPVRCTLGGHTRCLRASRRLEAILRDHFDAETTLEVFGSAATRLYSQRGEYGDMDLFLSTPKLRQAPVGISSQLTKIAKGLSRVGCRVEASAHPTRYHTHSANAHSNIHSRLNLGLMVV